MIQKWAKLLPYWLVMWAVRNNSPSGIGKLIAGAKHDVSYYQIDGGEFVVFSQDIQDNFDERKRSKRMKNVDKQVAELNRKLRKNYELKSRLRQQFEDESEDEQLGW